MDSFWDGRASVFHSGVWGGATPEDRVARLPDPGVDILRRSPFWNGYQADAGVGDVWAGPVGYFPSLYSVYGPTHLTDPADIEAALDLAAEGAREYMAVGTLVTNLPRQSADRWQSVRVPDACIRLDIAYACDATSGVSGMLARLPGHERNEWRRRWRRAREQGVKVIELTGAELLTQLPVALELANESVVKHGIEPLYDMATFAAAAKTPGARLICADLGERTLAAFLAVEYDRILYLWAGGISYEALRPYSPYLFLLYEILSQAPNRGWTRIEFGRGNYAFKRRYGFTGTELWSMYYAADQRSAAEHVPRLAKMHDRLTEFMGLE
jgi:hypothetical protein